MANLVLTSDAPEYVRIRSRIFSFVLSRQDLKLSSLVSRSFHRAVCPHLFRRVSISSYSLGSILSWRSSFTGEREMARNVRAYCAELVVDGGSSSCGITQTYISNILQQFPNLDKLELKNLYYKPEDAYLDYPFPNRNIHLQTRSLQALTLEKFGIPGDGWFVKLYSFLALFSHIQVLFMKSLKVTRDYQESPLPDLDPPTVLDLRVNLVYGGDQARKMVGMLPNVLRSLSFSCFDREDVNAMREIVGAQPFYSLMVFLAGQFSFSIVPKPFTRFESQTLRTAQFQVSNRLLIEKKSLSSNLLLAANLVKHLPSTIEIVILDIDIVIQWKWLEIEARIAHAFSAVRWERFDQRMTTPELFPNLKLIGIRWFMSYTEDTVQRQAFQDGTIKRIADLVTGSFCAAVPRLSQAGKLDVRYLRGPLKYTMAD